MNMMTMGDKGMFITKSRCILALNPVNRDEKFQYNLVILGEFYEVVYRVGRQISNHHRVHKRGGFRNKK